MTPYATIDAGLRVLRTAGIGPTETVRIFAKTASQDVENDPATNYLGTAPLAGQPQFPQTTTTPVLVVEQFEGPYGSTLRIFVRGQTSSTIPVTITIEFSVEFSGRVSS